MEQMNEEKKDKKIKQVMGSIENRIRHTYNCGYLHGYEDGQKHDADMLEKIKDSIRECEKIDSYLLSYPAWRLINKLKKIVGWQLEDYEERQTEEIKVGDEVLKVSRNEKGIVINIHYGIAQIMCVDGFVCYSVDDLTKTGRHFPQIAEVLEQMRKESE